jgi:outer membrane protein TolC
MALVRIRNAFHLCYPRQASSGLCVAGSLLLSMSHLLAQGQPVPAKPSGGATEALAILPTPNSNGVVIPSSPLPEGGQVAPAKELPITIELALQLALKQNPEILRQREKVNEAAIALNAANQSCVPEGLRKDTFKRTPAEAKLWRERAALRKVEFDQLQDVGNTYFDWLAAKSGVEIGLDLSCYFDELVKRAEDLYKSSEQSALVLVEATKTARSAHRALIVKLRQNANAAAIKLTYLLGLCDVVLIPPPGLVMRVDLVNVGLPLPALIQQAMDNGPAVQELEGLAGSIQAGLDKSSGAQAICNCTGAALTCGKLQMAQSQLQQTYLALAATRAKLRAGVEEAYASIVNGGQQVDLYKAEVDHARQSHRLMKMRLDANLRDTKVTDVLATLNSLTSAYANYLSAIDAFNKAEVRLLLYLGYYSDSQPQGPSSH